MTYFEVNAKEETKDPRLLRFLNNLEDIKNNAAREAGLNDDLFWKNVEVDIQAWNVDDIHALVVSLKKFPKEIQSRWGEKSGGLLNIAIKVYHEKGGAEPFIIATSDKKKKSKWG
ncbi:MAG: hypothetical protein HYT93_03770 [Parcubacteria group bacterium]|nr:hypothetical protein [Parcubacteria group bacterium]